MSSTKRFERVPEGELRVSLVLNEKNCGQFRVPWIFDRLKIPVAAVSCQIFALLHKVSYPRDSLALSSLLKYDDTTTTTFLFQSAHFNLVKILILGRRRIRIQIRRRWRRRWRLECNGLFWWVLPTYWACAWIPDTFLAKDEPRLPGYRRTSPYWFTGISPPNVPVLSATIACACAISVVQSVAKT